MPELAALRAAGDRRMSANPHANGGVLLRDLDSPTSAPTRVAVQRPARLDEATRVLGTLLRDVIREPANLPPGRAG